MNTRWPKLPLGEVISFSNGASSPDRTEDGSVIVYGSNGPIGRANTFNAPANTIIIGRVGSYCGSLRFSKEPCWVTDNAIRANARDSHSPVFLYYLMQTLGLHGWRGGSGQPLLNQRTLNSIPAVIPSPQEQRPIAALLASLDDKIEQNRRTSHALEKLARATFKAWFVDFEPVKAKAAGATSFPGMPPKGFAALPTRLVDSPTGPIPEGWETGTVGDIATLSKLQVNPQVCEDELFEHFSIPAYDSGLYPVVEHGGGIKSQKFLVTAGCVLLSKLNPRIPRVWLPSPPGGRRQIASTEFLVIVPNPGWSREALYCLFQQEAFRDSLAQSASGTSNSHQRIRPGDLLARQLVIPPSPIMQTFAGQAGALMTLRESLQFESSKLAGMRDYLLPRLLSGQVKINLAEDQTADALQC